MSEHAIQNEIRNVLAGHCITWRANVGSAWTGQVERINANDVIIRDARPFTTGLPKGFSDLFGILTVTITPDMVGERVGVFWAGEVKTPKGKPTDRQSKFLEAVRRAGGRSGVLRSAAEALHLLKKDAIA